jgi:hypothetical protein
MGPLGKLEDGTPFPSWAEVVIAEDDEGESPVLVRIELDNGRPALSSLTVRRRGPGESLGSSLLRATPVGRVTKQAVSALAEVAFWRYPPGGVDALTDMVYARVGLKDPTEASLLAEAELERRRSVVNGGRRFVLTAEHFEEVAEVYRSVSRARTRAIAEHWSTSYRNATRWIAEARRRGLLTEEEP